MEPGDAPNRGATTIASAETTELATARTTELATGATVLNPPTIDPRSAATIERRPPAGPPEEPTLVGRRLAHFRILDLLGHGGMGQVYRARDERLEREVALKVIHPATAKVAGFRERLLREARAAAAVSHQHIAGVYEVGVEGETAFIAMELVEGKTLRQALGLALPLEEALRLALQIARGIWRAHDRQILHRDLKPENVMITLDGDVKILDFGLAKRFSDAAPSPAPAREAGKQAASAEADGTPPEGAAPGTQAGVIVGTPGYMSPEQILGAPLDQRSDVFSFGVMLYEMVTGSPPFTGNLRQKLFDTLEAAPTPPARLAGRVPPALDRLILGCLARKPEERVARMADVVRELSQIASALSGAGKSYDAQTTLPTLEMPRGALIRPRALPSGPVTLVVAVVAEAALLVEQHGEAYPDVLGAYHALAARAVEGRGGALVSAAAEEVFAVFTDPEQALGAAVDAQRAFHAEAWPGGAAVRVRIGVHRGEPRLSGGRYTGLDVHRAQRIAEATAGGQVAVSAAARQGLGDGAAGGLTLRDLGAIRIKDLHYPEHLFALAIEGLPGTRNLTRSLSRGRSRLPEPPTAFVGRTQLIADVAALLGRDDARLVTLTGPGGTGKTRLSIEVARAAGARFPDGVVQVQLAAVTDPALVLPTIARALDLPEVPGTPPLDVLANGIGGGALLLLLDNFEQVVDAATAIADLLAACPALKVLVTSREILRVRGEREQGVPPLALPAGADFEAALASEAVLLFVERARDLSPAFALTPENAPLVSAICARLEAIPLAIELAASRTKMLSLADLHRRLKDRLGFAKATERDRAPRHRTLRATIDWSHDLLDDAGRILFRRVSVFRGGFSLESAEAVCGAEELGIDVLEGLSSLAGKSLLTLSEVDGARRLSALETLREYAQERLQKSPDEAPLRARHAEHFAAFVEARATGVLGRDWRRHVGPLLTEVDNVRAALDWALAQPTATLTVRLLQALQWFWMSYGRIEEGLGFTDRALAQTEALGARGAPGQSAERAVVLEVASWLRMLSGDMGAVSAHTAEGLAAWKALGREAEGARTRIPAGLVAAVGGSLPEGLAVVAEAYETCRSRGDRFGTALSLNMLAELARAAGDYPTALARNQELMSLLHGMGYVIQSSLFAVNLAWCHLHDGDWARAAAVVVETLELSRQMNNPFNLAYYLAVMACVAVVRGKHAEGMRLLGAFDTMLRTFGATPQPQDQATLDEYVVAATAALGPEAAARARQEGAAWTSAQAVAMTLPLRS